MIAGGIHPFFMDALLKKKKEEFDKEYVVLLIDRKLFDRMISKLNF